MKKKMIPIILSILIVVGIATAVVMVINNNNDDKSETKEENKDKKEDKETDEKNSYISTATTEPVSKDWQKYQFSIKGKTLSLPCSYQEFKDISGFSMKSSDEKSYLRKGASDYVNLYFGDNDSQQIAGYTVITNGTSEDLEYSKSNISRVYQTRYSVEKRNAEVITFPGDLKVGMEITKEDIIEMFGEPGYIRDTSDEPYGGIVIQYYSDEAYNTTNYYEIYIYDGKIEDITLSHLIQE